jgi:hypothetical protein
LALVGWKIINIKDLDSHINNDFILNQKQNILNLIKSMGRGDVINEL